MELPTVFRILPESFSKLADSLSLLTKVLGDNLYTPEALKEIAGGEDSALFGCQVNGIFVGTAMTGLLKKTGIDFYAPFGSEALRLLNAHSFGVLRNSAVENDYRGKGIGKAMFKTRLQWIAEKNCEYAIGLSWLHGKTLQSDRLYRADGFDQIGPVVPEFFKSLSERTGMHCPYCGFPCLCSAAMFVKKV
jgi:GNAT superfamily N-acetyltransferase